MGIRAKHLHKTLGNPPVRILTDVSLEIQNGDYVAVTGRSGSGKSSLLYLLSSLDHPTQGEIEIDGTDIRRMKAEELGKFRNEKTGFVFQFHYLLSELTAIENVLMPAQKAGQSRERTAYAENLLNQFGLKDKRNRLPRQLSGGEQQRVAIARALVMEPKYLFADEPTGSLDSENSENVFGIIENVNRLHRTTIILVTHDPAFAARARRQIHLVDGRLS